MTDALLLLSFGGPEGPDDVMPFLRNVVAGRNVPDERLAEVAEQYEMFGGVSPINAQNRALLDAVRADFAANDVNLPVYWGNRNWHPFVGDTVQAMVDDGVRSAAVFVTSAFGSYSGCRQYREDLLGAAESVEGQTPHLHKIRLFYNHPGFVEPVIERVRDAIDRHGENREADARPRLVFTAHSIPTSMAANCDYPAQLAHTAGLVATALDRGADDWDLVYQSRSGPPQVPWLEPDVGDHLRTLADRGIGDVVLVPLGFVSDHMEVLFDLDTQAAEIAEEVGIRLTRAATVGTHPRFVTMIRELVAEQIDAAPKLWIGSDGPWPDPCPDGHCLPPSRPSGAGRPGVSPTPS